MTDIASPKPTTVRKLLKREEIRIPKYQRSYSWEDEQVKEFLEDLENSLTSNRSWFLGILYTHEFGPDKSLLLDGQQRLTTLFILIKEILLFHENVVDEDEAEDFEERARDSLQALILEAGAPRLLLDSATSKEFSEYLKATTQEEAAIGYDKHGEFAKAHMLLEASITLTRSRLVRLLKTKSTTDFDYDKFEKLVDFVLDQIELIEIELKSNAAFHNIFENINDRGRHLTDSDKFKNLYCSLTKDIDAFEKEWFETARAVFSVNKDLDSDLFDSYFRSVGIEYDKDAKGFYATVRKNLRGKSENQRRLYVAEIFKATKDMARFLQFVERFELVKLYKGKVTDEIIRVSKVTNVLLKATWKEFKQVGVLAYASLLSYKDRSDKAEFFQFLTNLVNATRFYVSADLVDVQANEIRTNTVKIAGNMFQGNSLAEALDAEDLDYSSDLDFETIDRLSFGDNKKTDVLVLMIQALKNPALIEQYDPKHKWSTEHLLPIEWEDYWSSCASTNWLKLNSEFKNVLKKKLSDDDLTDKNDHRIQEFLGNKFYYSLGDNVLTKNRELAHKKKQINAAANPVIFPTFAGIKSIAGYGTFDVKEIVRRTLVLAPILIESLRSRKLPNQK